MRERIGILAIDSGFGSKLRNINDVGYWWHCRRNRHVPLRIYLGLDSLRQGQNLLSFLLQFSLQKMLILRTTLAQGLEDGREVRLQDVNYKWPNVFEETRGGDWLWFWRLGCRRWGDGVGRESDGRAATCGRGRGGFGFV